VEVMQMQLTNCYTVNLKTLLTGISKQFRFKTTIVRNRVIFSFRFKGNNPKSSNIE
jgi:hypothetical protein